MRKIALLCCAAALAAAAPSGAAKRKGGTMALTVTSPAFRQNGYIPAKYACGGADVSPELDWTGLPAGAKSVAVIMEDPDAAPVTWVHWILFDIPASAKGLKENVLKTGTLPDGSRHGVSWGVDEAGFSRLGYSGPCPPPGKPHRYFFKVYALDKTLGLPAGAPKRALLKAMEGHVLVSGELVGLYKR